MQSLQNFKSALVFFLFILSMNSFTQSSSNLDEDFLNSLDESVREKIEGNNEDEQELDYLLNSDSSVTKNKQILQLIKKQLDELEKEMVDDPNLFEENFQRFGESFFSSIQSTFMPINMPNFDGSYILDFGDKLQLQVVGANSNIYENIPVNRDGSITLPNYGAVNVAGTSLSEASKIVKEFISTKSRGDEAFLTLTEVRDIQIAMIGGVVAPGIYTVSGTSNILGLLNAAGGISSSGSFREIKLLRNNRVIAIVDLYDWIIFGKDITSMNLKSGDVILVGNLDFNVGISGAINNPAIYDIKKGENLNDLISFAGGLSQDVDTSSTIIVERKGSQRLDLLNVQNPDNLILQPKDSVIVPMYDKKLALTKTVNIKGHVNLPGTYSIKDGDKLSQLIKRAGGYKSNAYPYGGHLFRNNVKEQAQSFDKRVYSETINFLISGIGNSVGSQTLTGDFIEVLIEEFKSQEPINRIVTEFDLNSIYNDPSLDLFLADGDEIIIPQLPQEVYLFGDFNQPSVFRYDPSYSLDDYIKMAAGKKESSTNHIIVIDPDGRANYYKSKSFNIFNQGIKIYPGSIIYLPREIGKLEGIKFAATVAPIFSSLALSLASISAIDNN